MYDVTNLESFNNVRHWLNDINEHAAENVKKLLVGNKSDLSARRVVSTEQGREFADSVGIEFLETSAKTSENVQHAFLTVVSQIKARMTTQPAAKKQDQRLLYSQPVNSKKGCC